MKPSSQVKLRWRCPECFEPVGFLPSDLELPCPKCEKAPAREFEYKKDGWGGEA